MDYSARIRRVAIASEFARHLHTIKFQNFKTAVVLPRSSFIVQRNYGRFANESFRQRSVRQPLESIRKRILPTELYCITLLYTIIYCHLKGSVILLHFANICGPVICNSQSNQVFCSPNIATLPSILQCSCANCNCSEQVATVTC